jgi:hypothetical protein
MSASPQVSRKSLVVKWVLRVSQIKDDTRMRLRAPTIFKLLAEVNGPIERKTSILVQIDIKRLEVSWSIDYTNLSSLDKVIRDNQVLLVGSDLDIVRSDSRLVFVWIIETLDVVQVTDVESGDVICGRQGCVEEAAVLADVGAVDGYVVSALILCCTERKSLLDSDSITSLRSEIEELFNHTLVAICIFAQRVDNPELTQVDSSCDSC